MIATVDLSKALGIRDGNKRQGEKEGNKERDGETFRLGGEHDGNFLCAWFMG
jgi:hypothetical protein